MSFSIAVRLISILTLFPNPHLNETPSFRRVLSGMNARETRASTWAFRYSASTSAARAARPNSPCAQARKGRNGGACREPGLRCGEHGWTAAGASALLKTLRLYINTASVPQTPRTRTTWWRLALSATLSRGRRRAPKRHAVPPPELTRCCAAFCRGLDCFSHIRGLLVQSGESEASSISPYPRQSAAAAERAAEERGDAMRALENRTVESKQEMDLLASPPLLFILF